MLNDVLEDGVNVLSLHSSLDGGLLMSADVARPVETTITVLCSSFYSSLVFFLSSRRASSAFWSSWASFMSVASGQSPSDFSSENNCSNCVGASSLAGEEMTFSSSSSSCCWSVLNASVVIGLMKISTVILSSLFAVSDARPQLQRRYFCLLYR